MKRITVLLTEEIYETLRSIGEKQDRSVPNLLAHLGRQVAEEAQDQPKAS